jgi:hypothetical protein
MNDGYLAGAGSGFLGSRSGRVRRVPREHRGHRALLDHVVLLHVIERVHVRVVRARVVFEPLLDELEAGMPASSNDRDRSASPIAG